MSNEKWTRGNERTSPLDQFFQPGLGGKEEREKEQMEREREKGRVFRERGFTFSLSFPTIGPVAGSGARGRVYPQRESFASRSVLESFDKLQKCRGFSPTCFTFWLRVM